MKSLWFMSVCLVLAITMTIGCRRSGQGVTILEGGSDTMVNLAHAWAETYTEKFPDVDVQVSGGGSGVGIASLTDGIVDIANSSREMKSEERDQAEKKSGKRVIEHVVGLDALAVYVHKDNPLESISIEELAEIYGEGGSIDRWSQVSGWPSEGRENTADQIVRVSRQNNSGTYVYFREHVLGENRNFKLGSYDQSGSKDVVELVSKTPNAIGYSGMGYATDEVKMLKVSQKKGEPGVAPTMENATSGAYPLARNLYLYTLGEPTGAVKQYIDWIKSSEGQAVVEEMGYVPIPAATPAGDDGAIGEVSMATDRS